MKENLPYVPGCDQAFLSSRYEDLRNTIICSSENLIKNKSYNIFINNGMIKWCKVWEKYFLKPDQKENTNSGLFNLNNLENEDVVNLLSNIAIQVYQKEERDG